MRSKTSLIFEQNQCLVASTTHEVDSATRRKSVAQQHREPETSTPKSKSLRQSVKVRLMSSFTTFGHLYNVDNDGSHPVSPSSRRLAQALTFHTQPQVNTLTRSRPFVIGLVQARMGSTRLPGKVLLPLPANDDGMPVLWHVFQRLKASKAVAKWVLATSTWHTDNVLQEFGDKYGIDVWRGSEGDCLERLFTGAVAYGAKKGDYVVRITSDCPLVEARFIDQSVEECIAGKYDQYGLWDQVPRATRFADGLDVQVFSFDGMSRMNDNAKQPHEREHVGPYMMDHPDKFRLGHLKFSVVEATDRNWTLDNPRDYDFLCEVYSRLWKKEGKDPNLPNNLMYTLANKSDTFFRPTISY